jgi:hypothetical protein
MTWRDATIEAAEFLSRMTLADLQKPETWPLLTTLAQIIPDEDILPVVRNILAKRRRPSASIICPAIICPAMLRSGSRSPIAWPRKSTLDGRPKSWRRCISRQANSRTIWSPFRSAAARHTVSIPATDDFYRRLIDLRSQVKEQLNTADPSDEADLDSQQQALKILANATSYGIFVELIVEELDATESRLCFGSGNDGFPVRVDKVETPGHYFHPLLATLITGAAHLMLAIA